LRINWEIVGILRPSEANVEICTRRFGPALLRYRPNRPVAKQTSAFSPKGLPALARQRIDVFSTPIVSMNDSSAEFRAKPDDSSVAKLVDSV
jgi:hypothetical protein